MFYKQIFYIICLYST